MDTLAAGCATNDRFPCFDEPMDAKLRITIHQQMPLIGHHFELFNPRIRVLASLSKEVLQAFIDAVG